MFNYCIYMHKYWTISFTVSGHQWQGHSSRTDLFFSYCSKWQACLTRSSTASLVLTRNGWARSSEFTVNTESHAHILLLQIFTGIYLHSGLKYDDILIERPVVNMALSRLDGAAKIERYVSLCISLGPNMSKVIFPVLADVVSQRAKNCQSFWY